MILAIDPGDQLSAFVVYDGKRPVDHGKVPNVEMRSRVGLGNYHVLVVEMIASYGMPVGAEVFETCVQIGRLQEIAESSGLPWHLVYRREVKLHMCGQARAKDSNVRQALIDKYGGKAKAIGRKSSPGPLYGLKADEWQALAVAVTYSESVVHQQQKQEAV